MKSSKIKSDYLTINATSNDLNLICRLFEGKQHRDLNVALLELVQDGKNGYQNELLRQHTKIK
jgi:hypothetical protein